MESEFGAAQQQKNKHQLIIRYGISLITALGVGLITYTLLTSKTPLEQLPQEVAAYNKTLPMEVDELTRVDSISLPKQDIMQYHVTLHLHKADVPADTLYYLHNHFAIKLLNEVKLNPSMKIFRDNDVTIRYSFRDESREPLWECTITPDQYRK